MSDELVDQITRDIPLTWLTAQVAGINSNGLVTLRYRGGLVPGTAVSDQYTPVVGDWVQCLSQGNKGILVLCSTNASGSSSGPAIPAATVTLSPAWQSRTYDRPLRRWDDTLISSPDRVVAWMYAGGNFELISRMELARFEIQLTLTAGGPLEFSLMLSADTSTAPELEAAALYLQPSPPTGVQTWVPLPLTWAAKLLHREAHGIAVGGGQYVSEFAGENGQLRFTSI